MDRLVLTGRVVWEADRHVATVDSLPLEGKGDSVKQAQDELINVMRAWIEAQDGTDSLEQTLADAGFPGVEEETELQLEFVE